ncbi:MAG: hypothetical protein V4653_16845 [Pseudomonadota bacterium]
MDATRLFFIAFSILIGITGLFAAAWAQDYMRVFGLGLAVFGAVFAFSCVKRHYDERDAH